MTSNVWGSIAPSLTRAISSAKWFVLRLWYAVHVVLLVQPVSHTMIALQQC